MPRRDRVVNNPLYQEGFLVHKKLKPPLSCGLDLCFCRLNPGKVEHSEEKTEKYRKKRELFHTIGQAPSVFEAKLRTKNVRSFASNRGNYFPFTRYPLRITRYEYMLFLDVLDLVQIKSRAFGVYVSIGRPAETADDVR